MKVYTLIEDSKRPNSGFIAEHGLSLYFEQGGKRILFDTGPSGSFIYNATLLGIDLSKIDICIISHAHYDHTGGLSDFLDINTRAKVYMKSKAQGDYYTKRLLGWERSGIDPKFFEQYSDRIVFIDKDTEIAPGVFAANIDKYRHYPRYCALMYKKEGNRFVRDDLVLELFIAVVTNDGVIVFSGCSHHGILNIMMTANNKFGDIKGVIGGFHLNGTKRLGLRIQKERGHELRVIAKYMNSSKIKKVYTGHCTGEKPLEKLGMYARAKKMHSGDIIEI